MPFGVVFVPDLLPPCQHLGALGDGSSMHRRGNLQRYVNYHCPEIFLWWNSSDLPDINLSDRVLYTYDCLGSILLNLNSIAPTRMTPRVYTYSVLGT